jgi:hypothetical protein
MQTTDVKTYTRAEILDVLDIKQSKFYEIKNALNIAGIPGDGSSVVFTDGDLDLFMAAVQHIEKGDKLSSFNAIAIAAETNGHTMTIAHEPTAADEIEIPTQDPGIDSDDIPDIIRQAEAIAAQRMVSRELVTLSIAQQMTEDDLSDETKAKIEQVREATRPKSQAVTIAAQLLSQHRQNRQS